MEKWLQDQPLWVKVLYQLGLPVLVVLYILAQNAGYLGSPAQAAYAAITAHAKNDNETIDLLRMICQHTATDTRERDRCLDPKNHD